MALALTQCWFTRAHKAVSPGRRGSDGVFRSTCRYCERPIVSWDRESWHIADGFNILEIENKTQVEFLYLLDTHDDVVIARFPITHLETEAEIEAFAKQIAESNGLDQEGNTLELRDSRKAKASGGKPKKRPVSIAAAKAELDPSHIDRMTGLPNRAAFEDRFSRAPGVAAHTGKPLSVAIVSIDGLDTITRDNGRAAGDALIRTIGSTLEKLPGCLCHVSHNRGIEFLLLFDGASAEEAKALIDQARASLASYPQGLALISAGVARCPTEGDPRLVLYAVNDALREARAEGGDRVMIGAVSEAP